MYASSLHQAFATQLGLRMHMDPPGSVVVVVVGGIDLEVVVIVVPELLVVLAVIPLPGRTCMSAQFQNCSPQPKWPLGPAGPLQAPEKAVHQARLSPVQ